MSRFGHFRVEVFERVHIIPLDGFSHAGLTGVGCRTIQANPSRTVKKKEGGGFWIFCPLLIKIPPGPRAYGSLVNPNFDF